MITSFHVVRPEATFFTMIAPIFAVLVQYASCGILRWAFRSVKDDYSINSYLFWRDLGPIVPNNLHCYSTVLLPPETRLEAEWRPLHSFSTD